MADLTPKQIAAMKACADHPTGIAPCPARTAFALVTMGLAESTGGSAGRGRSNIRLTIRGRDYLQQHNQAA